MSTDEEPNPVEFEDEFKAYASRGVE